VGVASAANGQQLIETPFAAEAAPTGLIIEEER